MSKLLKGECVLMDAAGFVYISPSCMKTKPEPKADIPQAPVPDPKEIQAAAVKRAKAIVDGANRYLFRTHEEARAKAEEIFEDARREGFRQGYEEGFTKALAENEQALARIVSLMEKIDKDKEAIFQKYEQTMVDLALDVARKVVGEHLTKDDTAFLNIFQKAAESLRGQKNVRLMISKQEARFATSSSGYLLSLLPGTENLDIQVLEDAPPGTCVLETEDILIDASVQSQLEKLTDAIDAVR